MSVIKQISIFNGSNWEPAADIGVNAENVDFTYTTGSQQGNTAALSSILPAQVLTASRVLTTDSNGKLFSSNISSGVFNAMLSGATTANASFQSQIDTLNTNLNDKTVSTSQLITNFYDNRCENISAGEQTFIMKFGTINIAVIAAKMKKAVTSQQTSIFALPNGYNPPINYQSYGIVYNRTTGKIYEAQVSSSGNVNVFNNGEFAVNNFLYGQIVWMA